MPEIMLVRQPDVEITEAEKEAARKVMFGLVDGLGERGRKQWRRLWNNLMRLEPGEMVEVTTKQERVGPYHRRHMLLETRVFEAQERFELFEPFRDWLKIGAGHCEWFPGPRGGIFPVPNSIAYRNLEQGAMEVFHNNAVAFLRTEHAGRTLWPHATPAQRIDYIEIVLRGMGE